MRYTRFSLLRLLLLLLFVPLACLLSCFAYLLAFRTSSSSLYYSLPLLPPPRRCRRRRRCRLTYSKQLCWSERIWVKMCVRDREGGKRQVCVGSCSKEHSMVNGKRHYAAFTLCGYNVSVCVRACVCLCFAHLVRIAPWSWPQFHWHLVISLFLCSSLHGVPINLRNRLLFRMHDSLLLVSCLSLSLFVTQYYWASVRLCECAYVYEVKSIT